MAYTDERGLNLIIAIIPPLNVIGGVICRFSRGHALAGLMNLLMFPLFFVLDFLTVGFSDKLLFAD